MSPASPASVIFRAGAGGRARVQSVSSSDQEHITQREIAASNPEKYVNKSFYPWESKSQQWSSNLSYFWRLSTLCRFDSWCLIFSYQGPGVLNGRHWGKLSEIGFQVEIMCNYGQWTHQIYSHPVLSFLTQRYPQTFYLQVDCLRSTVCQSNEDCSEARVCMWVMQIKFVDG